MSSRFTFLFLFFVSLALVFSACSAQPVPTPPDVVEMSSATDDQAVETAPEPEDSSTQAATVTEQALETAATETQDTQTVDTAPQTSSATEDSDTIEYCPFLCMENIGETSCSILGDHWVRHAGYLCEDTAQVCCQSLGQPGGVQTSCAEQPALSCRNNCGGSMIQRTDYYCPDATKVCCEDPAGPTCTEMAGKCVTFIESCPQGYSPSSLECGSFVDKCCAPPICPWDCKPYKGDKTCSANTSHPTAVRNDQYACPVKGDICCQPTDAEDGIVESCAEQSRMVCRETCETYEEVNENYYCPLASRSCCEDVRPKCLEELDGQCVVPLLGCPNGMEKSARGVCLGADSMDCCVDASPLNQCAQQGGTCVSLGTMCPLLTTMDLATWCGDLTDICCKPML